MCFNQWLRSSCQQYKCCRGRKFKETFIPVAVRFANIKLAYCSGCNEDEALCLCYTYARYIPSISLEYSQPAVKPGTRVMNCQTQLSY